MRGNVARAKALPLPFARPREVAASRLALPRKAWGTVKRRRPALRHLELVATDDAPFDVEAFLALEDDGPGTPA